MKTALPSLATIMAQSSALWSWAHLRNVAVVVGCAASVFAYRGLLHLGDASGIDLDPAEAFFFAPSAVAPGMVFAVAVWFFANRWRRLRSCVGGGSRALGGAALLLAAGALFAWSHYVDADALLIPSLSLATLGAALATGGSAAARAVALPAFFLFFAFPIPAIVLNQVLYPVQVFTAEVTTLLLNAVGIRSVASGDRIFRPEAIFQVIESCSGLRTTITLLMSSVIYAELFPRPRWHRVLLIALAPVIGVIANEIRVISIVLNPYSRFAAVHTAQGIVVIVLGVFAIAGLDTLLGRALRQPQPQPLRWAKRSRPVPTAAAAAVLCFGLFIGGVSVFSPNWVDERGQRVSLSRIPARHAGWQAESLRIDRQFLGSIHFTEWVHRAYRNGADEVTLLVASDSRLRSEDDLLSTKTAVPATGWEIVSQVPVDGPPWAQATARFEVRNVIGARMLVERSYVGTRSVPEEILRAVFEWDRAFSAHSVQAAVVRVATPMGAGAAERARAEDRIRRFLDAFGPSIERVVAVEKTP